MSEEGKAFIKRREAMLLVPTWDAIGKVWNIGFGHVYVGGEPRVPITEDEAHALFDVDVHYYSDQVDAAITIDVPQPVFDAACSLAYNTGGTAFRSSSFLTYLNAGMFSDAAVSLLLWRKAKGVDVDGLINRRAKEMIIFAEGIYLP